MEYVSGIIILSVVLGVVSLATGGFRLTKTVRLVISLVMCVAVIFPLADMISGIDFDKAFEFNESSFETESAEKLYINECKAEIEKRLSEALTNKFGDFAFSVEIFLDDSDISAVEITKVSVISEREAEGLETDIISFVSEYSGCKNITVNYRGSLP